MELIRKKRIDYNLLSELINSDVLISIFKYGTFTNTSVSRGLIYVMLNFTEYKSYRNPIEMKWLSKSFGVIASNLDRLIKIHNSLRDRAKIYRTRKKYSKIYIGNDASTFEYICPH